MSTKTRNEPQDSTEKVRGAERILRCPPQDSAPPPQGAHRLTLLSLLPSLIPLPREPSPSARGPAIPSPPARDRLALRVRLLRVGRGWSQEDLAEQSGLHRNYIGHIERAELNAGLDNIEKIARAFGMTLCTLLDPCAETRPSPASITIPIP